MLINKATFLIFFGGKIMNKSFIFLLLCAFEEKWTKKLKCQDTKKVEQGG